MFTNGGSGKPEKGINAYVRKNELLFDREGVKGSPRMTVGIPLCLNMYEDYPFWHTLFTACGIDVRLSDHSRYANYEHSACMVMSDNICFPAKLVHSHIQNLIDSRVNRIFMRLVVYERQGQEKTRSPGPIVTGDAEVIK